MVGPLVFIVVLIAALICAGADLPEAFTLAGMLVGVLVLAVIILVAVEHLGLLLWGMM